MGFIYQILARVQRRTVNTNTINFLFFNYVLSRVFGDTCTNGMKTQMCVGPREAYYIKNINTSSLLTTFFSKLQKKILQNSHIYSNSKLLQTKLLSLFQTALCLAMTRVVNTNYSLFFYPEDEDDNFPEKLVPIYQTTRRHIP